MKAKTQIVVHGKKYEIGDTVTGLSAVDKKWMLAKGYISDEKEAQDRKQTVKKQVN